MPTIDEQTIQTESAAHPVTSSGHWPEGTPQPVPWQAVIDLQRHQTADENTVLEESIKHEGVQYPQILMPDGRIVDGHRRGQLATKLGVHLPVPLLLPEGTTDEAGLNLARELQWGRRNLSLKDWREGRGAIEEFYLTLRRAGATQVEAARAAGIARPTGAGLERRLLRRRDKSAGQDGVGHNVDANNVSASKVPDQRRKLSRQADPEVILAIAKGTTQKEVAEQHGVTTRTIRRHRTTNEPNSSTTQLTAQPAATKTRTNRPATPAPAPEPEVSEAPKAGGHVVAEFWKAMRNLAEDSERQFRSLPATVEAPSLVTNGIDAALGILADLRERIVAVTPGQVFDGRAYGPAAEASRR
jgi:hypothetical protein